MLNKHGDTIFNGTTGVLLIIYIVGIISVCVVFPPFILFLIAFLANSTKQS